MRGLATHAGRKLEEARPNGCASSCVRPLWELIHMNYRKDEYIRAYDPFPRYHDTPMKLGVTQIARVDGEPRNLHVAAPAASQARKVKTLKNGVRRISYR